VNGIHLWADLDTGRAYEGLAPLEEWELLRFAQLFNQQLDRMFPGRLDPLELRPDGLVISRDPFLVFTWGIESPRRASHSS
jgi:hypothetical protein